MTISQTDYQISRYGQILSSGLHRFILGSRKGAGLARAIATEILENYFANLGHDFDCQPIEADYCDASDSFRVLVLADGLSQIFTVNLN
jgi:hypothetical protein